MENSQLQPDEKVLMLLEKLTDELCHLNTALENIEANRVNENRTMYPKEAAAYLGITYDCLLRWAREGLIPSSQPGGHRVLFRQKALDEWLSQQEKENLKKSAPDDKTYGKLRKITA